jgi:mono/diheme cytochrome c family protein
MKPALVITLVVLGLAGIAVGAILGMPPAAGRPADPGLATWDAADPDLGRKAYVMCQACHGLEGRGIPGYAPPLAGASWLNGDATPAILIVLHGYDATSEPGAPYLSARMPAHGQHVTDAELAALLTWLRNQWGNRAPAITAEQVASIRAGFSSRSRPWTPAELRALMAKP